MDKSLERLVEIVCRIGGTQSPLFAAIFEYGKTSSNMDFVEEKVQETIDALQSRIDELKVWRG